MKNEKRIEIRVPEATKEELQRRAKEAKKSLSEYLIEAGLDSNYNWEKAKFFSRLNNDLDNITDLIQSLTSGINTMVDGFTLMGKQISYTQQDQEYLKIMTHVITNLVLKSMDNRKSFEELKKIYSDSYKTAEVSFKEQKEKRIREINQA